MEIVIVDFGMGNLRSIQHKLHRIDVKSVISSDPSQIQAAELLILPGVGHFARGMQNLRELGLISILKRKVIEEKTPIMGICLGMQLFSQWGEEGNVEGLGWIEGRTERFRLEDLPQKHTVPHVGWDTIQPSRPSPLLDGLAPGQRFYFTHSYHLNCSRPENVLATTFYGYEYVSCIQKESIFGVQFHPEKSHRRGMQVIQNFVLSSAAPSS